MTSMIAWILGLSVAVPVIVLIGGVTSERITLARSLRAARDFSRNAARDRLARDLIAQDLIAQLEEEQGHRMSTADILGLNVAVPAIVLIGGLVFSRITLARSLRAARDFSRNAARDGLARSQEEMGTA